MPGKVEVGRTRPVTKAGLEEGELTNPFPEHMFKMKMAERLFGVLLKVIEGELAT